MSDIPRCLGCGDKLPAPQYERNVEYTMQVAGPVSLPARGPYGDSFACSLQCAQIIMTRVMYIARERGMELRELLPPEWRPDLIPWDSWTAACKLDGKRTFVLGRKR